MLKYYIGIDGGGSKTRFLCTDRYGNEVGSSLQDGSYYVQDGVDIVLKRLKAGIAQCCPGDVGNAAICFGMPAYGENIYRDMQVAETVRKALSPAKIRIENDVVVAWAAATAMSPGIVIVGGTGTIGYGRDKYGNCVRCGGWHEFFSDEGSGYWLGRKLLRLFSQQSDGRLQRTVLYNLVRDRLGLKDDFDITELTNTRYSNSRKETAALQSILLEAARLNDPYAMDCYEEATDEMVRIIRTVASSLEYGVGEVIDVSYSGGLFSITDFIRNPLDQKLKKQNLLNEIRFHSPKLSPCNGAILLAMDEFRQDNLNAP